MITRIRNMVILDHSESGYSLIGISLFMVVLGIFISAGVTLKQKYDWAQRQEVTATNMALVKQSLENYRSQTGRLPCPASLSTGIDTASFGKESNCAGALVAGTFQDTGRGGRNIRYGAVPVRTLGLPDKAIVDGWGHRIVYAVTEYYASGTPDPFLDNGAITILDGNGDNATRTAGNVIYTVVSPGADPRGAYTLAGTQIDICPPGSTNCVQAGGDGSLQVSLFRQYSTASATSNNDFTATMTYAASEKSYEWFEDATPWSTCNCVAGATQTRPATSVTCRERGTNIPAPGMCPTATKPAVTRSCAAFCWGEVVFPACPAVSCGQPSPGPVTGTVDCLENDTKAVPASLCNPALKPTNLTQACPGGGSCGGGGGGGGGSDSTLTYDPSTGQYTFTVYESGQSNGASHSDTYSGSVDSRIMCTHFMRRGRLSRKLWRADLEFTFANVFSTTIRGYHFWGIPAVYLMRKYPWTEAIFWPIVKHRAEEIAYQLGLRDKPNYLGRVIRWIVEPLSFFIGIFVPEQNWKKVHADMSPALRRL